MPVLYFKQDPTKIVYIPKVSAGECSASDSWDTSENNVDTRSEIFGYFAAWNVSDAD